MIYKFDKGGTIKLQPGSTIPDDGQFDSIRPAHKIDLSKARRKEIRNFARNLAGMDNPEYGTTAKDYQEGFVNLGLNKRKSKFFDRVFRDQLAKNLEHTDRVNRDQQVIQAVKEGNFDPGQFGEWLALKRDESPITQKLVMPIVTGAAFGPAMTIASLAGEVTNLGTNAITGWDTWGKALTSGRKGWSETAELTNPGYIVTGPLANGGQRLVQGWKTIANSTKDLQNQAVTKIAKELSKNVSKSEFIPVQIKYYGPTMGKSYAAKTNPNLIDLDTWGRSEYDQLAKKYGYKDWREMILSDKGDYNEEYKQLIKDQIRRIQSDPQYSGKTIVVSNASLLKPNSGITFANTPVIPERSVMAVRNTTRHPWESIKHGEEWWDSLQRKGTPLKIDNRFISDIEGSKELIHIPKITIPDVRTYHLVDSSMPLSRPISEAEKLGLPKGERNQPIKQLDNNSRELQRFLKEKSDIEQKSTLGYILEEIEHLPEEYQATALRGRSNFAKEMSDKMRNYFADPDKVKDFNKLLKDYASQIESDIDPRIISTFKDGIEQPSIVVRGFRNYLKNAGVDASELSNEELAKILTQQYKTLSTEATGKLKDDILWHGSPEWFDSFDFTYTGKHTGNGGALGPGNYFSLIAGPYGRTKSPITYQMELNNTQPYIITGIQSTPNGETMIKKGILPEYIGPAELKTENGRIKLNDIIKSIPKNDNRAYIDLSERAAGMGADYSGPSAGVMVRRNTGIKSLYPHPSRFIRNSDGTVSLIPTNWSDVRVNFKQGGILKAQNGKPSYQDWLKTVNPDFIDKNYDLETAYNNLPFELLEAWRIDPENNHLPSGTDLSNGNWQYLKSPLHKSWFLNNAWEFSKEGKEWKNQYVSDNKFPFVTLYKINKSQSE